MEVWSFSSAQYIKAAIDNVENYLREKKKTNLIMHFLKPRDAPNLSNYSPDLDEFEELEEVDTAYCQSLVDVLKWIVWLGRVDINDEVLTLSSCLALPRFGHKNNYIIFSLI